MKFDLLTPTRNLPMHNLSPRTDRIKLLGYWKIDFLILARKVFKIKCLFFNLSKTNNSDKRAKYFAKINISWLK